MSEAHKKRQIAVEERFALKKQLNSVYIRYKLPQDILIKRDRYELWGSMATGLNRAQGGIPHRTFGTMEIADIGRLNADEDRHVCKTEYAYMCEHIVPFGACKTMQAGEDIFVKTGQR